MFCPECQAEYRPGFTRCSDCDVDLVEKLPELDIRAPQPKRDWMSTIKTRMQTRESKSTLTVYLSLFLCLVGIVVSSLWWKHEEAANRELQFTYSYACMGDSASIEKLARQKSSKTTALLRHLALGKGNCFSNARVAAIQTLGSRKIFSGEEFDTLLKIDQSFDVRHAMAQAINKCDEKCTATVLSSLNALSHGQTADETKSEMEFESRIKELHYYTRSPQQMAEFRERLRVLQEQALTDYFRLLSEAPCHTQEILKSNYAEEAPFMDFVRKNVPGC
jgi:hypothetical protein